MKNTRKIVSLILITALCMALMACANEVEELPAETEPQVVETEPVVTERPPAVMLPDHLEWWEKNNDVVGWIRLGDTRINYPILQGEDNDYYMMHDFEGNVCLSESCITADYKLNLSGYDISDNFLIYGHNSAKNTYFAALSNYWRSSLDGSLSYYKKYPVVNIDTMYENAEWKIFACVLMNTQEAYGDVFKFWEYPEFPTEESFYDYILNVMDRSILFTDVDLEYGDKIATLSTCLYPYGKEVDTRCVVFARRVRPGESSDVDVEKAKRNDGRLKFRHEAQVTGKSWNGRTWDVAKYMPGYKGKPKMPYED